MKPCNHRRQNIARQPSPGASALLYLIFAIVVLWTFTAGWTRLETNLQTSRSEARARRAARMISAVSDETCCPGCFSSDVNCL